MRNIYLVVLLMLSLNFSAMGEEVKIAIASIDQAWLSPKRSVELIKENAYIASENGAGLIVFSESFIGGYPYWHYIHATIDLNYNYEKYLDFYNASITKDGYEMKKLQSYAKRYKIAMIVPFNERNEDENYKSVYNSAVFIDKKGKIKHITRKTRASHTEKLFWAEPKDPDIRVVKLAGINVAYNSCWQTYLPLIRGIQYAQGAQLIVVGTQDQGEEWNSFIKSVALEGHVYLASVTQMYQWEEIEKKDPELAHEFKQVMNNVFKLIPPKIQTGDGMLIDPWGKVVIKGKSMESKLVYGIINTDENVKSSMYKDATTNYRLPIDVSYRGRQYIKDGFAVDKIIK
ncbi:nitrilase-related carbon-nitrogen hydrolase [Psychrilyobacter atlanticus]|uniref:nitrilase-related carbon-nitrogen hydrolase n=1 Tax=Psychrilyobacter atlanticus TaxID=271091 RepID=UPI000428D1A8|nr:nitrilase-related carbon-nitrogen hydrolase [Psychrilyobacter atlanticus]